MRDAFVAIDARHRTRQELLVHGAGEPPPSNKSLQHYGSDAAGIEALALPSLVHPKLTLTEAEVRWHVRHEMARTVEDVLARRSRCLLLNARASSEAAPAVARIVAEELGKDEAWQAHQVQVYQALAAGYVL